MKFLYVEEKDWKGIDEFISWKEHYLPYGWRKFKVFRGELNGNVYIKPQKILTSCEFCEMEGSKNYGYHCYEYQHLFNFSGHCKGFNENRITQIFE